MEWLSTFLMVFFLHALVHGLPFEDYLYLNPLTGAQSRMEAKLGHHTAFARLLNVSDSVSLAKLFANQLNSNRSVAWLREILSDSCFWIEWLHESVQAPIRAPKIKNSKQEFMCNKSSFDMVYDQSNFLCNYTYIEGKLREFARSYGFEVGPRLNSYELNNSHWVSFDTGCTPHNLLMGKFSCTYMLSQPLNLDNCKALSHVKKFVKNEHDRLIDIFSKTERASLILSGSRLQLVDNLLSFADAVHECDSSVLNTGAKQLLQHIKTIRMSSVFFSSLGLLVNVFYCILLAFVYTRLGTSTRPLLLNVALSNILYLIANVLLAEKPTAVLFDSDRLPPLCEFTLPYYLARKSNAMFAPALVEWNTDYKQYAARRRMWLVTVVELIMAVCQHCSLLTFLQLCVLIVIVFYRTHDRPLSQALVWIFVVGSWLLPCAVNFPTLLLLYKLFVRMQEIDAFESYDYRPALEAFESARRLVLLPAVVSLCLLVVGAVTYCMIAVAVTRTRRRHMTLSKKPSQSLRILFITVSLALLIYYGSTMLQLGTELYAVVSLLSNNSDMESQDHVFNRVSLLAAWAKILALADPLLNPIVIIARTKQLRMAAVALFRDWTLPKRPQRRTKAVINRRSTASSSKETVV